MSYNPMMSSTGIAAGVPPAGKTTGFPYETADKSIRQDLYYKAPSTPPEIKKFRKSFNNQPGVKQAHYGTVNDPLPGPGFAYGKKVQGFDKIDEVVKAQNLTGLANYANDLKEGQYSTNKREPLGKTVNRNYNMPEEATSPDFRYGVPTVGSESAKEVLYPIGGEKEEPSQVSKMYNKSHGNFAPGEQKTRDYNWKFDKDAHRFGASEVKVLDGAAMALQPERYKEDFPKTVIVQKTVEDHKAVTHEVLGKSKNLGQGKPPLSDDHIYGLKNVGTESWNAAKCIHGEPYTEKMVMPDKDLGKSLKIGCTNTVRKPEDQNRVFGAPTIRTDIPKKAKRSVADHNNYGDEPEAIDLLAPSTFVELGITEEDFNQFREQEEIRDLFASIGHVFKQGKFMTLYNRARDYCGGSERVSIRAFLQAIKDMKDLD